MSSATERRLPPNEILVGDVLEQLRTLPDECVHCVVTSPPYWGLRDYGVAGQLGLEPTPAEYVGKMVEVFREVRRVLQSDGTLWLNIGDSYCSFRDGKATPDSARGDDTGTLVPKGKARNRTAEAFAGTGTKHKDLVGIPWMLAFALRADGWWLRSDIIWHKCLSGGSRVYARTQKGDMPMTIKDLVRLDPATVKLWNGERWTAAVSWTKTTRRGNEIELVLRSGERIGCTPEHRWPTGRGIVSASEIQVGDVIQTCRLPAPEHPRTPSALGDADIGWFVGLYIAEGSQSNGTIQLASHADQQDRFDRVARIAEAFDGYAFVYRGGGKTATVNVNCPTLLGVLDAYVSGRTAHDKHPHTRCWKRSDGFLRAVLDGYLSGDGHWTGERWRLGFCDNDNLAADLRTLCARLGMSLRLKRTQHQCNGKKFPGWRGEIRDKHRDSGGEVMQVVPSRARQFWDIAVADDPHLFALASGVLTHNSNPMPESVTDRPTKAHEYLFLMAKSERYYFDAEAIAERAVGEWNSAKSSFASTSGTDAALIGNPLHRTRKSPNTNHPDMDRSDRNRRTVWTIATEPFPEAHFATFPQKLVEPCVLAGCPEGGIVLDPFMGSGTTGLVALKANRKFIGIELNPAYAEMARGRLAMELAQGKLC